MRLIKPQWVPALPPEARTIREDNGKRGLPSLLAAGRVLVSARLSVGEHYAQVLLAKGEPIDTCRPTRPSSSSMCVRRRRWPSCSRVVNKVTRLGLLSRMAERVTFVLIPPLLLIFLVLGTIFLGVATPTEGGAMGAIGRARHGDRAAARLSLSLLRQAWTRRPSCRASCVFILIGSTVFSLSFQGVDGPKWVEHLLTGLPGGQLGFLIVVNVLIFFLAFFLDFFELSFIVVPLLGAGGREAGHRPDLVRRAAGGEHADLVHAPAVRLRAVLPAQRRADRRTTPTRSPASGSAGRPPGRSTGAPCPSC